MDCPSDKAPNASRLLESADIERAVRKHDRVLVRWLAQKFGDLETARDIAQSTYLRVWRYAQIQPIDNLQALIFKTAANLAANEFRARKRMKTLSQEQAKESTGRAIEWIACPGPSPEATTLAREEVAATLQAIEALPQRARRAFILSRFEEKTYREIAALLDVSESSIEKYIIAALKALRLAAEGSGRPPNIVRLRTGGPSAKTNKMKKRV